MRLKFLTLFFLVPILTNAQSFYFFTGTYTNAGSKGIYVYRFNAANGKVEAVSNTETDSIVNPSYLAVAPGGKFLYAANETGGKSPGSVSAFSFDKTSGKLTFLNKQSSGGDGPCYVSVTNNKKWVFSGNYSGGSLAALAVNDDGSLQPPAQTIQHVGKSVMAKRQDKPHVHSTNISPDQNFLFVPDLGMDKVFVYKINSSAKKPLTEATPAFVDIKAGSGPRHMAFHPNNKYVYLITEMGGSVDAYKYDNGKATFIQNVLAHPADFTGEPGSADIHVSPDGKFLYASNRGDENNIAIFAIDAKTGKLALKGLQKSGGKAPRNFSIDPSGNYLLAANQDTDNIVIFKINHQTGLLTATGEEVKVSRPVCIKFIDK